MRSKKKSKINKIINSIKTFFIIFVATILGFSSGFLSISYIIDTSQQPTNLTNELHQYFFQKGLIKTEMLRTGWATPEDWGVWSIGKRSVMILPLETRLIKQINLIFELQTFVGRSNSQVINVFLNNKQIAVWYYKQNRALHRKTISTTWEKNTPTDQIELKFEISNPSSPKELGVSHDTRRLGLGISQISLETKSSLPDLIIQK